MADAICPHEKRPTFPNGTAEACGAPAAVGTWEWNKSGINLAEVRYHGSINTSQCDVV